MVTIEYIKEIQSKEDHKYRFSLLQKRYDISIDDVMTLTNHYGVHDLETFSLSARLFCIWNDVATMYCHCGNVVNFRNRGVIPNITCSKKCTQENRDNTCFEKYGSINPFGADVVKNKIKNHYTEKYGEGVTSPMHVKEIIDKQHMTNITRYGYKSFNTFKYRNNVPADYVVSLKKYRKSVLKFTNENDLTTLVFHELRGNICDKENAYHLDHIISVKYGFDNLIHPVILGSIHNLRFIPGRENISKHRNNSMLIGELFSHIMMTDDFMSV